MAARLGFSTGKRKNRRQLVQERERGGFEESVVGPRTPSPVSEKNEREKKKGQGRVLETGSPSSFFLSFVLYWQKLRVCRSTVRFRTGGIIRSIMNESCHRRFVLLGWPRHPALQGMPRVSAPSLCFCVHASQSFESALQSWSCVEIGVITLQCLVRVLRHTL